MKRTPRHRGTERKQKRFSDSSLCLCVSVVKFLLIVFIAATTSIIVSAETLIVSSSSPFQSIQSAINSAQPGDVIQVQSGAYDEHILLNKPLTLEGINQPIIRGSGKGSVLIITADRCMIKGFVIERSGNDLQAEDSGILVKSSDNRIENCELREVLFGIYLYHASRNTIRANVIRGMHQREVGERGAGLHIWNSANNVIEENSISHARDGMYIQTSPGNVIRHNLVHDLRYGLHYMNSDDNRFEDNQFLRNVAGAAIMYSRRIELRRNSFAHNRGFSSFGILFQDCDNILAEDNYIIDNATGLFMEALRKSTFRRNLIAENDQALQIYSSSDQLVFTENNFIENLSPLWLIGRKSSTTWQQNGRGNYWSDYDGYDLDGNGIGDVTHKVQNVFEYLEGNFPRLRLYLNSPAAQSLATAEKTLPIIKGSNETDTAPLMKAATINNNLPVIASSRTQSLTVVVSLLMLLAGIITIWKSQRTRRTS